MIITVICVHHFITNPDRHTNIKFRFWNKAMEPLQMTWVDPFRESFYMQTEGRISTGFFQSYVHLYLNLRPLCWFIFALGATPSTAMKKTLRGLMILKSTSR